jgi:hypothetical protein
MPQLGKESTYTIHPKGSDAQKAKNPLASGEWVGKPYDCCAAISPSRQNFAWMLLYLCLCTCPWSPWPNSGCGSSSCTIARLIPRVKERLVRLGEPMVISPEQSGPNKHVRKNCGAPPSRLRKSRNKLRKLRNEKSLKVRLLYGYSFYGFLRLRSSGKRMHSCQQRSALKEVVAAKVIRLPCVELFLAQSAEGATDSSPARSAASAGKTAIRRTVPPWTAELIRPPSR